MADQIFFLPQQPIEPIGVPRTTPQRVVPGNRNGVQPSRAFEDVLQERVTEQNKLKFSGHAQQRLRSRNIRFTEQQMNRLNDAVERAAEKGSRDSLLLVDNVAAVVSVENRTVVTVANGQSLKDNVFTNIDSAVIA